MFVTVYLKAKSAPKSLYMFLQQCGLSLSYDWAENMLKTVSAAALNRAAEAFAGGACILVYDNYRARFGIKHQQMNHMTATDNGTTATILQLPLEATRLLNNSSNYLDHSLGIKKRYIDGTMRFPEPLDFHRPVEEGQINKRLRHNILAALFCIPEVATLELDVRNHLLLKAPDPVDQLPHGAEFCSKQHMLGTMDYDESTLSGNNNLLDDSFGQLGYKTPKEKIGLARTRKQYVVGDQLTHLRGETLQEIKQGEFNTLERHDWLIWIPGWFHILMNFGRAIYFEHFGTSTGLLLARDVASLGWAGLKQPTLPSSHQPVQAQTGQAAKEPRTGRDALGLNDRRHQARVTIPPTLPSTLPRTHPRAHEIASHPAFQTHYRARAAEATPPPSSTGRLAQVALPQNVVELYGIKKKQPTRNKGPDFHILDEAFPIILDARYRTLWLWAAGVSNMQELADCTQKATAEQLESATNKIWAERASSRALQLLDDKKIHKVTKDGRKTVTETKNQDNALESSIRLQRDLMLYEELQRAIRFGDVGQMENLVPKLLIYFAGSKRWNYTRMLTSVLQWHWHEAPPSFAEVTRRHAWLVNFNGKPDGFYEVDRRQELNNLMLRANGPTAQSSTWERHREMSPAMPVFSSVVDQFDRQMSGFYRSRQHRVCSGEDDISNLVEKHQRSKIFEFDPTRLVKKSDINKNVMEEGEEVIFVSKYLQEFATERQTSHGPSNLLEISEADGLPMKEAVQQVERAYRLGTDGIAEEAEPVAELDLPLEINNNNHVTEGPNERNEVGTSTDSDEPTSITSPSLTDNANDDEIQDYFGEFQGVFYDGNNVESIADALYSLQLGTL
ncbi:Bifunctional uridylyltransferase/uridylyl-removing enzyme [Rhizoctonia solani]|uniref:Bifunctional uridylyltransferase/uridylyl-removing enzyme n=1 Tax=Rhizoctonia solani TaxID=456999 RepID=A0A0K6GC56_9AGAM|nr:Bifunctional uridylyltransferase/uridylyl-removing enzyme [Rhizoctonia solani]